jgi:hypothetical protein
MSEYSRLLVNVLSKSRSDATNNVLMGIGFLVFNLLVLRGRTTFVYVFAVVLGLQVVFAGLRRFKLRAASPLVQALADPTKLERVRGWPYAGGKYPPGKVPQFVVATAKTGAKVRLKVGSEPEIREFVAGMRRAAPELEIAVPNVG